MSWLIRTSLELRLLVMILAVVLVIVGIRIVIRYPLDVFPEFAPPLVEIQTEAPGISTEDVESLITVPIENAVNGIPFVQNSPFEVRIRTFERTHDFLNPAPIYWWPDNSSKSGWLWPKHHYPLLLVRQSSCHHYRRSVAV